jgi:deoxyribonuclease V
MQKNTLNNFFPEAQVMQWSGNIAEARAIQDEMRHKVKLEDDFPPIKLIAGIDVSYNIKQNLTRAFIVLMLLETLKPLSSVKAELPTTFPYVPGFLSFREIPAILEALKLLPEKPDLFMVDGQGIAHPRRMGIAAHLGVLMDMPAIGVAKSRLNGKYDELGLEKGASSILWDKKERIGTVLRSKDNILPLFISPGHRVSHDTALALTNQCLTRYRLPEPTRIADKLSKAKEGNRLLV